MAEHRPEDDSFNLRATYGGDDVNLSGLGKFVAHLIILVVVSAGIVYGAYRYLRSREANVERQETPSTRLDRGRGEKPTPEQLFPEPRLQTTPIPDLSRYKADQQKVLEGYQDQGQGTVSIPIEEAKRKLLEEEAKKSSPEKPVTTEKPAPTGTMRSSQ